MAFCPHCGKQVTEQAIKCIACGGELEPKGKAARFKGTMMMTPATAPGPTVSRPEPAPPTEPKPAAAPAPRPAAPAVAAAPQGPSKVMKATMLGTGGPGLPPPPGKPGAKPPEAPPAAAGADASPWGAVAPAPPPAAAPAAPAAPTAPRPAPSAASPDPALAQTTRAPLVAEPASAKRASETQPEDSQRFLVGDPMAPKAAPARHERRPGDGPHHDGVPTQQTGKLLAIGIVGMLVIAAVGYLAASFMGLL
jgi:hypothetical protein